MTALADGSERWTFETGGGIWSSPSVAGGVVFVGSLDGHMYAVDVEDGSDRWVSRSVGRIESSPTVVDGILFVGSHRGTVYALDAGVAASIEDSRVTLGTLGHHNRG